MREIPNGVPGFKFLLWKGLSDLELWVTALLSLQVLSREEAAAAAVEEEWGEAEDEETTS